MLTWEKREGRKLSLGVKLKGILIKRWVGGVAALYTPLGDVEEIFNPLGVSLGASES
jgi:hypothetical protein